MDIETGLVIISAVAHPHGPPFASVGSGLQREPAALTRSSVDLVGGRSTLHLPIHGLHLRNFRPQQFAKE